MSLLYVARHGETAWNVAGRYQGRLESDLSPLGIEQARALAKYFAERSGRGETVPQRVISSPLRRCTATAAFSADALGLAIERDPALTEIAHGTWEGRYRDELARNDAERYRLWRHDPARVAFEGGEALTQVLGRWRDFAARAAALGEDDALAVTHDAVVRCALLDGLGRPLDDFWKVRVENAAFAVFARDGAVLTLLEECHAEHLARLRADIGTQAL